MKILIMLALINFIAFNNYNSRILILASSKLLSINQDESESDCFKFYQIQDVPSNDIYSPQELYNSNLYKGLTNDIVTKIDESDNKKGNNFPIVIFYKQSNLNCIGRFYSDGSGRFFIQINHEIYLKATPVCQKFIILHEAGHIYHSVNNILIKDKESDADQWAENIIGQHNLRENCTNG